MTAIGLAAVAIAAPTVAASLPDPCSGVTLKLSADDPLGSPPQRSLAVRLTNATASRIAVDPDGPRVYEALESRAFNEAMLSRARGLMSFSGHGDTVTITSNDRYGRPLPTPRPTPTPVPTATPVPTPAPTETPHIVEAQSTVEVDPFDTISALHRFRVYVTLWWRPEGAPDAVHCLAQSRVVTLPRLDSRTPAPR